MSGYTTTFNQMNRIEWLKHPGQDAFHAYRELRNGELALCKHEIPLDKETMILPADSSRTCRKCFEELMSIYRGDK